MGSPAERVFGSSNLPGAFQFKMTVEDRVWAYRQTRDRLEFAKIYQESAWYRTYAIGLQRKHNRAMLGNDPALLEEIADHAFMKAVDRYEGRNGCSFNTFFYTIFRNKVRDEMRKIGLARRRLTIGETDCDLQPSSVDAFGAVDNRDLSSAALSHLSPLRRLIVSMHHDGYSFSEIARALGKTYKCAGNKVSLEYRKAIKALKTELRGSADKAS